MPEERSRIMSRVKGTDTQPEKIVRSQLHHLGFRFRLHRKDLPGKPDIVLPRYHKVVFVHGCFWHGHPGCPRAARPTSNSAFWEKKLTRNAERDAANLDKLEALGWDVLIVWQCETKRADDLQKKLIDFLKPELSPNGATIKAKQP